MAGEDWGRFVTEINFDRHSIVTNGPAAFRLLPPKPGRKSKGKRKRVEVRAPLTTKITKGAA
jgi:hypothetical protein